MPTVVQKSAKECIRCDSSELRRIDALLRPNSGALHTLVSLLGTVIHSPYYPSHLSSCRKAVALSCSLAQALTPVEGAADLSYNHVTLSP